MGSNLLYLQGKHMKKHFLPAPTCSFWEYWAYFHFFMGLNPSGPIPGTLSYGNKWVTNHKYVINAKINNT